MERNITLVATTLLLVLLLTSSGLPFQLGAAAGALYLVHPANAETAIIVFQAKTLLSTALALGAVWLFGRRPLLFPTTRLPCPSISTKSATSASALTSTPARQL